jgi:hypothetical protein
MSRLVLALSDQQREAHALDERIRASLREIGYGDE